MTDKNSSNNDNTNLIDDAENRETENPTLGTHLGYEVHIAIRREPSGSVYPDDFGVNVYIPQSDGEHIDIGRIDTSHGVCHIDRLYLPDGHDQRRHDDGFSTRAPEGAVRYITEQERWREWVERYDRNHGLP